MSKRLIGMSPNADGRVVQIAEGEDSSSKSLRFHFTGLNISGKADQPWMEYSRLITPGTENVPPGLMVATHGQHVGVSLSVHRRTGQNRAAPAYGELLCLPRGERKKSKTEGEENQKGD
ncbi:hypothetical protein AVEN_33388-1 [Araneus ventricosus]|uniref:Uncharacterized protein n=1 Tax=Araneus ventricosus TaxID=182803 RepID=A0A4Y2MJ87_ARAVE|nr:hypothetical protein AVEN_33388-1 [Araneus ventricosus]